MTQNLKELAKVNLKKKQKQELSREYWLALEAKAREKDNPKREVLVIPRRSNRATFKEIHKISKTFYKLLIKNGLTINMLDIYRTIRKTRKKSIRKIEKAKLFENQMWRRAHPRKKLKGGKPKGKQNKQNLEPVKKVKAA